MKKYIFFFILFPSICFSQTDSQKKKVIGFQVVLPFELGGSYYFASSTKGVPLEAAHLLNNNKATGVQFQILSAQLHFYDKFYIGIAFNMDNTGYKKKEALNDLRAAYPGYFIQQESKYVDAASYTENSYSHNYLRTEIGLNVFLKRSTYLQPFVSVCYGKPRLPKGRYSFKDNSSNYFFMDEYSYKNLMMKGINIGVNFNRHMPDNQSGTYTGYWGIKLDYTMSVVTATGMISCTDLYRANPNYEYKLKRTSQYISLAIFLGLSTEKDKRQARE